MRCHGRRFGSAKSLESTFTPVARRSGEQSSKADRLYFARAERRLQTFGSYCSESLILSPTATIESRAPEKNGLIFHMIIDAQTLSVLQDIEAYGRANDAQETDRARRMLNLERSTAELIQIFVLSSNRKRILEIGTSNGYSALWLGAALRAIPGAQSLATIERDAGKARQARSNVASAGLS